MDAKPDTIKISAFHREEIFASHANLYVTVKGSSIFSGGEAMKKAREVSQLVEALTRYGLGPEAIQLQGVRIESASGPVLKSSSAVFRLKIKTEKVDQLAERLDTIAEQKNATLERIDWKYPEEQARASGLEAALAKGREKAVKVASLLASGFWAFMTSWKTRSTRNDRGQRRGHGPLVRRCHPWCDGR